MLCYLWKSSFRPPLLIALALISIRLPLKSPLQLMLIAFALCRHRFMDLRLASRPRSPPDPSRSMNDFSGHMGHSCRSYERF